MKDLFSTLHRSLKTSIINHYTLQLNKFPDLYGYSLYSHDVLAGVTAIPAYESLWDNIPDSRNDPGYRYIATEWLNSNTGNGFQHFEEPNKIIKQIRENRHNDENYDNNVSILANEVLEICLTVLIELKAEGLFGKENDTHFVNIFLSDSNNEIMTRSVKTLNSPKIVAEALVVYE